MNERHVVVGAGPVGLATAELLVEQGKDVVLVSRSGTGPEISGVRREAADVADAGRLVELAEGAVALYNCVNPPSYTVWPEFWPPVAAAFLAAAEQSGAVLVTAAALYPYGPVDGADGRGPAGRRDDQEGPDPWRDVGRGEGAARRRPDQGRRGARLGLRGTARLDRHGPHRPGRPGGPAGQDRPGLRQPRPAALVHRRARHGPGAGPGRRRAERVGTGLARADQPRQDPDRGAPRRLRPPSAAASAR